MDSPNERHYVWTCYVQSLVAIDVAEVVRGPDMENKKKRIQCSTWPSELARYCAGHLANWTSTRLDSRRLYANAAVNLKSTQLSNRALSSTDPTILEDQGFPCTSIIIIHPCIVMNGVQPNGSFLNVYWLKRTVFMGLSPLGALQNSYDTANVNP